MLGRQSLGVALPASATGRAPAHLRYATARLSPSRPDPKHAVTELLAEHRQGNATALDRLFPLVYDELRGLARYAFARPGAAATLQPTALVHEAWLKLARLGSANDRQHFLAIAARAMRQVLHNHARDARAQKRGGDHLRERITQVDLGDAAAAHDG